MTSALLLARALLAAVFAVAGAGKLADRAGSREAVRAFGGPARHAGAVAPALAVAELATAVGLLVSATAWWAAVAGLVLLALFTAAIARSMRAGRLPDCHCFGRLHSATAGPKLLARNAVLVALAGAVVAQGPSASWAGATRWLTDLDGRGWLTLGVAVAGAALLLAAGRLLVELLRRNGRLLARVDQLEATLTRAGIEIPKPPVSQGGPLRVGERAPEFTLPDLDGRPVALAELLPPDRPLVLVFASPSCAPCRALLERLAQSRAGHGGRADLAPAVAIVGDGGAAAWRALPPELLGPALLLQEDGELAERYGVELTPSAVVVSPDGLVAAAPALGGAAVAELIIAPLDEPSPGAVRPQRARPSLQPLPATEGTAS